MRYPRLFSVAGSSLIFLAILCQAALADECEWCRRNAARLTECDNKHISEEDLERWAAWDECIDAHMTEPTLDANNPELIQAQADCAHLAPGDWKQRMVAGSLESFIVMLYTGPCFHMGGLRTQYFFEASFEAGLGGVEEFEERGTVKKLKSILTIDLYYDGEEPILVKSWQTKSSASSISSQYNRMFKNPSAAMRQDKPLEKLLWEFEKTPTNCRIKPDKEMVEEGEEITIKLTDFRDTKGEPSREFNRIVVQANWGKILNGERLGGNPKMAAFKVGNGSIEVRYKAPDTTALGSDLVSVFNSCDIVRETVLPLSETSPRDRIALRDIPIARPGVTAQVTRKFTSTTDYTKTEHNTVSTKSWTETSEITVSMTFAENPRVDVSFDPATMQMKPNRYVYTLANYSINSSNYSGSGSSEETVGGGEHIQRHVSASTSQNGTFQDLKPSNKKARLTITVEPATGKATEISIPSFDASISINSQYDCSGEKRVKGRMEPFDCSNSSQFTKDFPIQPLTSDRETCHEISGGDGLQIIRGNCSEQKTTSQGSQEETYEWVIYKRD